MKIFGLKKLKAALAIGACAAALTGFSAPAQAAGFQEYPIGDTQEDKKNHFNVPRRVVKECLIEENHLRPLAVHC